MKLQKKKEKKKKRNAKDEIEIIEMVINSSILY